MVPHHARITAENFYIPSDFNDLQRTLDSSAQIGGVRLELLTAGDGARLGSCYQQVPVRVLPPFHFPGEPAALLYLLNPTAGLMDGDGHRLDIHARAGVRAVVTGQSATRIHPALRSFATQQWHIRVEEDAQLVILPGPAIPFRGCRYYQRVRIDLAARAHLIWGDIWLPGRYARGALSEFHQFERIVQDLEVRREGNAIYRERFSWCGPWDEEMVRWHLGDRQASGSLFATGSLSESLPVLEVDRAILPLASGDTCVRWCGCPAEIIREVVRTALRHSARQAEMPSDRPWLLGSHHFAPNHWFSSPPT
ncbi:MAG TPA: urease accessory protein UreD [Gemmataceae bacterium]|nr:urease accessory protein UreD [Gemmataceae bacterium]